MIQFGSGLPLLPERPRSIAIIGCGGIVLDAHVPAYSKYGFRVSALCDQSESALSRIAAVVPDAARYTHVEQLIAESPVDVVFDVAVPAAATVGVLRNLPKRAAVLIQKPLGEDLTGAREIAALCKQRQLDAAVNFQLRYAPYVQVARQAVDAGLIGEVHDMEVRITVYTPWHLWTFLEKAPRVEILYHSIHYIDLIRSFFGDPRRVKASTLKHPDSPKLHSTRSTLILDYGNNRRANITTNHGHHFGLKHQESYIKWEGTRGAIRVTLGLLINYPEGEDDGLEMCQLDGHGRPGEWTPIPFEGSWYPDAFAGSMGALQRFLEDSSRELPTRVDDALHTMAVVEAAYADSELGGSIPPEVD